MIVTGICVLGLLFAIFFLLRNLNEILMIVRDTFKTLQDCQRCVREMVEDNHEMLRLFKDFCDFDRNKWSEKPAIIVANEKKKKRKLSDEHKKKIGEANKARKKEKEMRPQLETQN